ncbi:hypothetical protein KDA00_05375, partial [Candidatus Saccharibacteria bacterium]|nr:hypothetical protein [Candidatus Saccharibacteria bacterium]
MKIDNATTRLTVMYTLILLVISAFFSANLYRISIQEIDHGFQRQSEIINSTPRLRQLNKTPEFIKIRQDSYNDTKEKLLINLFVINTAILVVGSFLSYIFAKKTLIPIEESHRAQAQFTSDASHELRTPISVMRSETEVALKSKNLSVKEAREVMESNLEEINRLTILINNLLQLAQLEDGQVTRTSLKLKTLFSHISDTFKKTADDKKISINFPKTQEKIYASKEHAEQLIGIVLSNAIKYSPENSKIDVSVKPANNIVNIDIKDQGIGINKNEAKRIFERFYRADKSRSKQGIEGYGLGLSIA